MHLPIGLRGMMKSTARRCGLTNCRIGKLLQRAFMFHELLPCSAVFFPASFRLGVFCPKQVQVRI